MHVRAMLLRGLLLALLLVPAQAAAEDRRLATAAEAVQDAVLRAQPRLLARQLDQLAPQRPGVVDLYFLGFGGDAVHDVFLKEVRSAQALFDQRFDTRQRSVVMANSRRRVKGMPLASIDNLRAALGAIGARIDPAEDVVFLYLTSHGSPKRFLSVFSPYARLENLQAQALRDMLDEAGIGWRVVVISACFSGSFIDALKDERTLILTAASKSRASFGCNNEDDYTYFGDAYLNRGLRRGHSFIDAFTQAKAEIAAREAAEGLKPSRPQISLGSRIGSKLDALERRLRATQ